MNNINKFVIVSIILFFNMQLVLFSQPTMPDPIVGTSTPYTAVESAYGPRNYNGGTVFHLGIDYPLGKGGRANSIESDDIISFSMDNSLGYVIVGNWKYQHILVGEYINNGITYHNWELVTDGVDNYIFIRTGSGTVASNYTTIHAYSNTANINTKVTDPWTKKDITIEKYVALGDQIFASNLNHLDIRRYPANDKNPFSDILHRDATTYNITIVPSFKKFTIANNATDFITVPIPSSIYGNAIIVQAEVNATIDKDLDNLQIQYSNDNGVTYNDLHSYYYTGANHNVHETDVIRPNSAIPIIDYQKYTTVGIYPHYNVFGHLFFKYIWNSTELIAPSTDPKNGLYPDGKYKIRMLAHDVTGHETSNISEKIIDNLRPFIRKIEYFKTGYNSGAKFYNGEWIWDETYKKLAFNSQSPNTITDQDKIFAIVYTSEPMKSVNITAFGSTDNYTQASTDGKEWKHEYPASSSNKGIQNITINSATSLDLAGNPLEGFTSTASVSNFPKHNTDGTWTGAYERDDVVHQINNSTVANVPANVRATDNLPNKVAITWNTVVGTTPYYKVFRQEVHSVWISGAGSGTEISGWISGTSYNDITATEETEYYYYVQSSTNSSGTTPSAYSSKDIGKAISPSSACYGYEQTSFTPQFYKIEFYDLSAGDIVGWTWNFGDGTGGTGANPSHFYDETGTYRVSLITEDANGNFSQPYSSNVYITDQQSGVLTVDCYASPSSCKEGEEITLTGSVIMGGTPPYNYRFSLGDGNTESYLQQNTSTKSFKHTYTKANNYQVLLTVTDNNGLQGTYPFKIYVNPESEFTNVTVNTVPQQVLIGKDFSVKASTINGDYPLTWILWIENNNGPGNYYFYNSGLIYNTKEFNSPKIPGLAEGTYKAHLLVFDPTKQKIITFSIIVSESKDPCIDVNFMQTECSTKMEFPMGATISLDPWIYVYSNQITWSQKNSNPDLYPCNTRSGGNNFVIPKYDGVKMIKWFYDDNLKGTIIYNTTFSYQGSYKVPNHDTKICGGFPRCDKCRGCYNEYRLHCFELDGDEGEHTIRLEAYGGQMSFTDPYDPHPFNFSGDGAFSSVTKKIILIDCDKIIPPFTDKSQLIDFNNKKAGYITITPASNININYGESLILTAHKSIIIDPGIEIEEGSDFIANIEKCPEINDPCGVCTQDFITQINKKANNDTITDKDNLPGFKSEIQVYPNPTNNLLYIDLSGNLSDVLYYEVYNSLGKLLYKKVPVNEIEEYSFQGNTAGLYLFRATYLNGDIELKRIVYTK